MYLMNPRNALSVTFAELFTDSFVTVAEVKYITPTNPNAVRGISNNNHWRKDLFMVKTQAEYLGHNFVDDSLLS